MTRTNHRPRKNTQQVPLFNFFFISVLFALSVRVLCLLGVDTQINSFLSSLAQNSSFISFVSDEPPLGGKNTWVEIFRKESRFSPDISAQPVDDSLPLVSWVFSPAPPQSEKKEFPIKAINLNPVSPTGYTNLGKIYLKNDTSKKIDLNSLLKSPMPFALKGTGAHVLIVHTHGSEAYFPEGKYTYTPDDVERTLDKNYNVIRVGDEMEKILKEKGVSVIHDRNIYDSPSYNGSYTRTLNAISSQLKKNPSIKVVIDLHRDAMTASNGVKYKTSAKVNGKDSAQIMLVMSTGESGLAHPDWKENLKFAVKLQCQIVNKYPGLMRPINLRKERFNMHATTGSMLVEVGTSANSMQEALTAIRPFSEELALLLNSAKK